MINNNSMRQVVFSVPPVLYQLLKEEADRKAQSVSAMIRLILAERYTHIREGERLPDETQARRTPAMGAASH